tara:strand:+ start:399 stop:1109 length:711 start_codon:yes stop_codon:yes gene_type:complete
MKLVDMLKSEIPEYTVTVNSKKMKFRPFLVKEEKNLLLVVEEGEMTDVMRAIKNVLESCFEDLDTNNIALAEAEYLFLKLRQRSVSETLELLYRPGGGKTPSKVSINLNDIACPKRTKKTGGKIKITDKIAVSLKDITLDDVIRESVNIYTPNREESIKIISMMIDTVTMDEEVLSYTDISAKDRLDFVEAMTENQFSKLVAYAKDAPILSYTYEKDDVDFTLTGLNDFFSLVSLT